MSRIELNGCRIDVLPVVRGLVSEELRVEQAISDMTPEVVGLSISKEELAGLALKDKYEEYEMSYLESAYKANLETFGEVKLPPPCFVKAYDVCKKKGIKLIPLDMQEELYTDTYCVKVGGLDILRESFLTNRAHRVRFDLSSPEKFVLDWDRRVNKTRGFRELVLEREKHMADVIQTLARHHGTILAVIEVERAGGIEKALARSG